MSRLKYTLIVIDNFDTSEDTLLDEILHGPYQILFTTRMNFDYLGVPVMALGELEHVKQIELFKKNYKRPLNAQQMPLLEELLQLIQGHTLTIELIARLMATKHVKMEVMLDQLKQVGISPALTGSVHHKTTRAQTVYSHIEALFDLESLSGEELLVMQNLSLMPLAGVSFGDFMEWCHYEDGETINTLIERSWIKYNVEQDLISLHPVIADIVRSKTENFAQTCSVMLDELTKKFRRSWDMDQPTRTEYGEIAKNLFLLLTASGVCSFLWHQALHCIFVNSSQNDFSIETIKSMKVTVPNPLSIEEGWLEYHIADFCLQRLYYAEAREHMEKSIACFEKVYPESYDIAYMKKHIAHIYHAMYQLCSANSEYIEKAFAYLTESEEAFQISIKEVSQQYGSIYYSNGLNTKNDHISQTASRYYAFGLNAYYREDYDSALKYSEESYRLFLEINGEVNTDTHAPMQVLSRVYSKLGKLDEAVVMQQKVIADRESLWSKEHYHYCSSVKTLADIYFEHGKVDEGLAQLYYILECLANKQDYYINYIQKINEKIQQYERA